ncbi:ABC transporter ATP-binding protein [Leptospira sp. GIMC2001]|uniref:ABC transporter ATP-binding protein n=1 Tax=Leptospira sp. GIMC2001 TaxID=1513297 RepID=UPI00234BD218|nr:ABC transporter ATP-binding protein [Leptospira sp. GIMC2001]WCL49254.1 ABC transporter ATP-binding protein [Leptospira sp. GIMC2001]
MLEFQSVNKSFKNSTEEIHVVKNVHFTVRSGEFVAIVGPSGSGKSTLLGMAAGLDRPDDGFIILDSTNISSMNEDDLAKLRSSKIGFVFQNFQLLPNLTALENVAVPLMVSSNLPEKEIFNKALELLQSVSMDHRASHFPLQLSGGEEQRIAIARSFVNDPKILFADEPTANLDTKNGNIVMQLLQDLNRKKGSTLIVVTHDHAVAALADRVFEMKDGELTERTTSSIKKPSKSNKSASSSKTIPSRKSSNPKAKKSATKTKRKK